MHASDPLDPRVVLGAVKAQPGNAGASREPSAHVAGHIELKEFAVAAAILEGREIFSAVGHRIKVVSLAVEPDRRPIVAHAAHKVALPNVRSAACRRDRVLKLNEFTTEHRIQHVITIPAQMIPIVE